MSRQGKVRKLPSGSWRARYRGTDGRERGETFTRKADAERWLATQEADVARGLWVDPTLGRITFGEYVEIWRAGLHGLRDSSLDRNLGVARCHLLPRFGAMQLARISPVDVRAMVGDDMVAGYSSSSVRRHVIVLRSILGAAVSDGRLGRNVADGVKLPSERARPMRVLDPVQLAAVAHAVPGHYRALVLTAGWVGLRWGELAGLALDHVDLLRHTITIDRQLTEVAGRLSFGPPKTGAGVRTVTIPEDLTAILAEHFGAEVVTASGLAFPTVRGKLMRRSVFRPRMWNPAVTEVFAGTDLAGLVFHELRHTAASLAIAHGAHPVTVKERLGHSSISVTMDRYGHMFPSQDAALAEALNATLRDSLVARTWHAEASVARLRRSEP